MSRKDVIITRYVDRKYKKYYYDGMYLRHDVLMKLIRKGYTLKVVHPGENLGEREQKVLGYKMLLSYLIHNVNKYSDMKICEIGDSIQKIFAGNCEVRR
tara:strand:- start:1430 stop:1726 length:297 start_codon:yes stop_codon:yes gene_type:complete